MSETIEKTEVLEISEKELSQISEEVVKGLDLDTVIAEATKSASEKAIADYVAKTEEVKKKAVKQKSSESEDLVKKGIEAGHFSEAATKESKEVRFAKAMRALVNGQSEVLRAYNKLSIALKGAGDYGQEQVDADGGYLVPDADFDTTVYSNLPRYGVALQFASVSRVNGNSVRAISLDSGVTFYQTAEAGVKQSSIPQFSQNLVELNKYAAIIPATDEMTEDAAIDYWNTVTQEVTRDYARVLDEIVFTNATSGITNTAGVLGEAVSGAGTTITWDDLLSAEARLEDGLDTSGYRWFMRRETFFRLVQLKGTTNDHYLFSPDTLNPTTPWGTPVSFTRVLPKSNEVGANDAFAVYGNLSDYKLKVKNGLVMEVFNQGIVKDTDGDDFNLITQDAKAMRAVFRAVGMLPKGNASKFVIIGTGSIS